MVLLLWHPLIHHMMFHATAVWSISSQLSRLAGRTLWHDPVRTIMGVQKDVQPWRSQDPTFFQHGGKLFVWGLLAFSRISDKPKIVDLMLVAHYGESPSLRPMSAVRSEWPHVPDARKVVLVDAVSGHRATLWQVRGHLPMPTDGPSTTTVAAMV